MEVSKRLIDIIKQNCRTGNKWKIRNKKTIVTDVIKVQIIPNSYQRTVYLTLNICP